MSDATSSSRTPQTLPGATSGDGGSAAGSDRMPLDETTAGNPSTGSSRPQMPFSDEQPTIISDRPPVGGGAMSDSANRILQGKIMPGDRLDHFEVVEYVGGGGMGRVFRATDTQLSRQVALKVLLPEQTGDNDARLRFQNEAQSTARLDHPNIARVYHVGEDRGLSYIVFEFIEGTNIRKLVQEQGPLTIAEAVSYTLQVAEALAHAAGREVVHRDVKPSNVLVTPEGYVKLIDMGLARLKRVDAEAADLTATGVTLGTFDYISPEQARDPRNADVRSDIYSLGCTFFYMLTGRPPFPEGTVLQKLLQHQGDQPPDIRDFRPELPESVARVLQKMLAKDPRHRYRDPGELLTDLMLLADQVGLRPVGPGGKMFVPPKAAAVSLLQNHLPWIAPIVALIAIVVLLDSFWSAPSNLPSGNLPIAQAPSTDVPGPGGRPVDPAPPTTANGTGEQPIEPTQGNEPTASHGDTPGVPVAPSPGKSGTGDQSPNTAGGPLEPIGVETSRGNPLFDPLVVSDGENGLTFDPFGAGLSISRATAAAMSMAADDVSMSPSLSVATHPTTPHMTAASDRANVLVVRDLIENEGEFTSLSVACRAANNNDIIELHYNGRREERPIKTNQRFTIRAGEGYRPIVVFRPDAIDPVKYPRSMFTVEAGQLTLCDLAIELHVPREVSADHWSLFETHGAPTVRLQECTLTIANASDGFDSFHEDVAFFRVATAPYADMGADSVAMPAGIELSDCVARGEAVFLRTKQMQPARLTWNNGLLITSEQLVLADSGREPARPPAERIRVDLRHVTAAVRGGFCRLQESRVGTYQGLIGIDCSNSIILTMTSDASLIEQVGSLDFQSFCDQVTWRGDTNFYERMEFLWTFSDPSEVSEIDPMTFEDWQLHWGPENENLPTHNRVLWRTAGTAETAPHGQTAADYILSDAVDNPAIGAAPDGSNSGHQTDRLPPLPAAAEEESPNDRAAPPLTAHSAFR